MSLPEISRRCLSCGAAVRAGSRFCQQCGKALEAEPHPEAPGAVEEVRAHVPPTSERALPPEEPPAAAEPAPLREPTRAKELTPPTKEFAAFAQSSGADVSRPVTPEPVPVAATVEPEAAEEASENVEGGRAGDLRGRVARVREETRARVGRMREEAIVVLEETPDDSGLRFVLVAAALFIISLVLLFLSTTVLR
jgi:hypothetical protein